MFKIFYVFLADEENQYVPFDLFFLYQGQLKHELGWAGHPLGLYFGINQHSFPKPSAYASHLSLIVFEHFMYSQQFFIFLGGALILDLEMTFFYLHFCKIVDYHRLNLNLLPPSNSPPAVYHHVFTTRHPPIQQSREI